MGDPLRSCNRVCRSNGKILRETKAVMEVGLAGITRSAGKPRTWGSGEAERRTDRGNIPYTL